ncbi:hypothetical protein HZS_7071, partial [Henneguya salminicola]
TYIGRTNNDSTRREPLFSIDLWNTYESTLAGLCQTNNNVEGWHNSFSKIIDEGYHLLAVKQLNQ